jgi:hypothetical protein
VLATFSPRNVSVKITLYETLIVKQRKIRTWLAQQALSFLQVKGSHSSESREKHLKYRLGHTHDASTYPATRVTDPPETYTKLYTVYCLQEHLGQNLRTSHHTPKRKERKQNAKRQH